MSQLTPHEEWLDAYAVLRSAAPGVQHPIRDDRRRHALLRQAPPQRFHELTEALARAAERDGLDCTPFYRLTRDIRRATDETWLAAEVLVRRMMARAATPTGGVGATDRRNLDREKVNRRAKQLLSRRKLTARKLADALGVSLGYAHSLPAWKSRPAIRPGTAKLKTESLNDALLGRLVAEQAADFEPSPLDRGKRRNSRCS